MTPEPRRTAQVATALLAVAIIGLPLAALVAVAIEDGPAGVARALGGPLALTAVLNTVWTSTAVAVLATLLGSAAALLSERWAGASRHRLRALLVAPLVVPPFILASGWTRAFGPRGLTDQLLGIELPGLYGPLGIVLVLTVAATPLTYLVVAGALASRVEPDAERAARASGAAPWTVLRTVTLPLLRPSLASAAVVAFVFATNAFGVPAVLGSPAGFATITTRLYQDLAFSADPAAFQRATALATTLVVLAIVVVGGADALFARGRTSRTGLPAGAGVSPAASRLGMAVVGVALAVTIVLPFVALVLTALTRAVGLPPVPANWTLANFDAAIDGRFVEALGRSVLLAVAAATIVLALGALAATAARTRRSGALATAVTLGFAIPGSALAVALLLAYGGWLRDTLALILLAYLAKFWALGHRQLAGSLDRLPVDLLRAARASGAGPVTTLRTVVGPILRPSLAAGWILIFVFALHELTMSSLLYGPGTSTLAVIVLGVQQLGDPGVSAALAVLLTLIVAAAAAPLVVLRSGGWSALAASRAPVGAAR